MKHLFVVLMCLLSLAAIARAEEKEINLYAWSEYIPQELIKAKSE